MFHLICNENFSYLNYNPIGGTYNDLLFYAHDKLSLEETSLLNITKTISLGSDMSANCLI